MKEYPILFSTPMVRAILEGRKTQTRRVMKPQPYFRCNTGYMGNQLEWFIWKDRRFLSNQYTPVRSFCPFGIKGDRLWVRETWMPETEQGKPTGGIIYKATGYPNRDGDNPLRWKPSIHMPKAVARIWLEITFVRVERIQDITETDAQAEGVNEYDTTDGTLNAHLCKEFGCTHKPSFSFLWDSLNEKRGYGWDTNPWVWVIEFRRVDV